MDAKIPPQNLIRQVSSDSPRLEPGFYKQLVFDVLTIASSAGVGYAYNGYLGNEFSLPMLLAAVGVLAVFSALQLLFTKSFGRRAGILALEVAAFFALFYKTDVKFFGTAAVIMFVLLLLGEISGRREIASSLEIRFMKSVRPVFAKLTTALILAFIILYVPHAGPDNVFVSRETFRGFFDWAAGLVGGFYQEVRLNSTFAELAEGIAKAQLEKDSRFRELTPAGQAQILEQTTMQISQSLSRSLGIEIKPDEPVAETVYDLIVSYLRGLAARYGNFFLVGWIIVIFIILRGFGTIFYWVVGVLAFIIYQVLLASNFVHIVGETRTKEVIEW